jgi:hypothetical protein
VSAPAFVVLALVALALGAYVASGEVRAAYVRRRRARPVRKPQQRFDPGVERRAELKARALLRSIVNLEEWEMYRDLGFIRVVGRGPGGKRLRGSQNGGAGADPSAGLPTDGSFSFLIYPHKPIVAYLPGSNSLLSEYCVEFPDRSDRLYGPKLPDSDDVLAKWMLIRADEERLLRGANMHLPGRQVDPQRVRRDLWRLAEWERARAAREAASETSAA